MKWTNKILILVVLFLIVKFGGEALTLPEFIGVILLFGFLILIWIIIPIKNLFKGKKRKRKPISNKLRQKILRRDNFTCQLCGAKPGRRFSNIEVEVDHRTPWSKGGSDKEDNLWTTCYDCNRGKSNEYDDGVELKKRWWN